MNPYYSDSVRFFRKAASLVKKRMSEEAVMQATLMFALGIERELKGILYEVNPIYVYRSQDFKNTAPVIYGDLIRTKESAVASNPDADVISYRVSLERASVFSATIRRHSGLLRKLSEARDIIAHRPLSELSKFKLHPMLMRDLHIIASEIAVSSNRSVETFLGKSEMRLAQLSAAVQFEEDLPKLVEQLLNEHRSKWWKSVVNRDHVVVAHRDTLIALTSGSGDVLNVGGQCPSCLNQAIISTDVGIDYTNGEPSFMGAFPVRLRCHYCGLTLEDYRYLDYLDIARLLSEESQAEFHVFADGERASVPDLIHWFESVFCKILPKSVGSETVVLPISPTPEEILRARFPMASESKLADASSSIVLDDFMAE